MKGSALLLFTPVSLFLALLPFTSAACTNLTITPVITETYSPVGAYGTIYVESSPPGAAVYLNGDGQGYAPVTIMGLWPGTYTISARLAGYKEYTSVITMSEAKYSSVYCPLEPDCSGNGILTPGQCFGQP